MFKDFTLLDTLIAILIGGVIIYLAIPRMAELVEFQRSEEALKNIKVIIKATEKCAKKNEGNYSKCSFQTMDIKDPNTLAKSNFDYHLESGVDFYKIRAVRNTFHGGSGLYGDHIVFDFDQTRNSYNLTGSTAFEGVR